MTRTYTAWQTACAYRSVFVLLTSVLTVMPFVFGPRPLAAETKASAPKQHFACNVGYTLPECQVASTVLRKALARYPVDALGEWTWVLVRTEDWKQILSEKRFDSINPAFTYLPTRETFLDGALVVRASIRGVELSAIWHMPIEDLLDLAIRHELAHALCNDRDETNADRAAIALKNGTPLSCRVIEQASAAPPRTVAGSEACAGCHADIYKSYRKTVMANASGLARDALITGEFVHRQSGVHYRVYEQDGQAWMSYERRSESGVHGERRLSYFIGSGLKGRTYLFRVDGFLFEAPINWYSQEGRWNMAPAYTEAREIPMNLSAFVDCLNCHSSGVRAPVAGTESKFSGEPFQNGGITCERCHGGGDGHVNPAKLSPERRDAICMQCHFEGTVAVQQPGKQLYQFQPGEQLTDYIHYFLLSGNQPQKPEALSQFEALSLSECKRKSGDKMWCGSCHDPHAEPGAKEKAAYYRSKCLNCHAEVFAAKHHPGKPDCMQCHMPALPSKDVAHTEGTDHRIQKYPKAPPLPRLEVRGKPGARLVSFPASDAALATTRDFALAWETLAQRDVEGAPRAVEQYLQQALKERPEDPALLSAWGFVEQQHGHEREAREIYERALKIDPVLNDAATNLGFLEARAGNLQRAVELWQGAFARAPGQSAIGMNLAIAFCLSGQRKDARKYVERVLEFNPDYGKGKSLLENLKGDPVQCKP